ncbi:MAG: molybdopterin-dependent oxidoreductase [Anaerolineales bacterium]|nr:molybdopterin-dependent oxidoreductase [Anaerolineales bacterium]
MNEGNFLTNTLTDVALTRRSFLKWSAALGGTAALAGGLNFGLKTVEKAAAASIEDIKTVACYHNCGGRCVLGAVVKDGTVVRIVADPTEEKDPITNPRAIPCQRGRAQIRRVYAPDRLKYPMKRGANAAKGKIRTISWDEALDMIASELQRIKKQYGQESIFFMQGLGEMWTGPEGRSPITRLLRLFGGHVEFYNNYSFAAFQAAMPFITGGSRANCGNYVNDILNSKLVVLFGDNSCVTRAGGDNAGYYYVKAKEHGVKFIVIDPVYTDTAIATAADWVPINGGTDVALIAAMAYVMVKENLYDKEFMAKYAVGFDEDTLPEGAPANSSYMAYLMGTGYDMVPKTPEWAAPITGIPAERIVQLARQIATTKPCAMFQGWGIQRRAYGEQAVRAVPTLAAMTGNFGIKGGSPGLRPTIMPFKMGGFPLPKNPVTASIPLYLWTDYIFRGKEMTNGARDKIKGAEKLGANMKFMWNHAGNTVLNQHANINRTKKLLEDDTMLEMLVSYEVAMTPTAKFSDILLPATTGFEVESIITGEGHAEKGGRQFALFNHQVIEPMYESKNTLWVMEQLADRLGIGEEFRDGHMTRDDWMRDMIKVSQEAYPDFPSLEKFKEMGVYKITADKVMVAFAAFREDPVANPLETETGKIEVYSPGLVRFNEPDEIPAIPLYIPEWEGVNDPLRKTFPLQMSGYHAPQRSHSTFDNTDYLREALPQMFWINPLDAESRGIQNGDKVKVFNDRGATFVRAYVTNRVRPGAACLAQGAWYTPDQNGMDTNGSINMLTNEHPTPLAKGTTQHTTLVQVEKA